MNRQELRGTVTTWTASTPATSPAPSAGQPDTAETRLQTESIRHPAQTRIHTGQLVRRHPMRNGTGKSSTLRVLLGLDHADAGTALIDGVPYRRLRDPLRRVGAVLDGSGAHRSRTVRARLRWMARSNGIGKARVDKVIEQVGLAEDRTTKPPPVHRLGPPLKMDPELWPGQQGRDWSPVQPGDKPVTHGAPAGGR
ncbi:MAG: ATP-binding cassette domain-containing protein [Trebonia sp.]